MNIQAISPQIASQAQAGVKNAGSPKKGIQEFGSDLSQALQSEVGKGKSGPDEAAMVQAAALAVSAHGQMPQAAVAPVRPVAAAFEKQSPTAQLAQAKKAEAFREKAKSQLLGLPPKDPFHAESKSPLASSSMASLAKMGQNPQGKITAPVQPQGVAGVAQPASVEELLGAMHAQVQVEGAEKNTASSSAKKNSAQERSQPAKTVSNWSSADFLQAKNPAQETGVVDPSAALKPAQASFQGEPIFKKGKLVESSEQKAEAVSQPGLAPHSLVSGMAGSGVVEAPSNSSAPVITGHVTQGGMNQPRLSSESLIGVNSALQQIQQNPSFDGGSIRIRLKPESLGEIHLKVATEGNQVRLKVQAADEKAKSILEASADDLRASLTKSGLHLAALDFGTSSVNSPSGSSQSHFQQQSGNSSQNGFDLTQQMNQEQSGRSARDDRFTERSEGEVRSLPRTASLASVPRAGNMSTGRLDLMA